MVRTNEIIELLGSIGAGQLEHDQILLDVLPRLIEWLGFPSKEIRFEYPVVYGPSHRIRIADAAIVDVQTDEPWLFVEVKGSPSPAAFKMGEAQLMDLLGAEDVFGGVLLTPRELYLITHSSPRHIRFREMTVSSLDSFRKFIIEGLGKWRKSKSMNKAGGQVGVDSSLVDNSDGDCRARFSLIKAARTNDEKKKSLESFMEYLISKVDCLRVKHRDRRTSSSEIDLIVENVGGSGSSFYDEFGRHFLVECKNWADRVGAKEVRDFVGKMLKTKQRLGILAARKGVTGANGGEDALREIQFCYDKLDVVVLVVTENDMKSICLGANFTEMLDAKLDRIRFDFF